MELMQERGSGLVTLSSPKPVQGFYGCAAVRVTIPVYQVQHSTRSNINVGYGARTARSLAMASIWKSGASTAHPGFSSTGGKRGDAKTTVSSGTAKSTSSSLRQQTQSVSLGDLKHG